jgi:hypothetical protein
MVPKTNRICWGCSLTCFCLSNTRTAEARSRAKAGVQGRKPQEGGRRGFTPGARPSWRAGGQGAAQPPLFFGFFFFGFFGFVFFGFFGFVFFL